MLHLRASLAVCVSLVLSASLSAAPQFGSDSCSTPDVVPPSGSITFFNVGATTGPQGQGWTMCDFVPTTGPTSIENDVWFVWTAPATGTAEVVTCTSVPGSVNSRFAVYAGAGCPTSIPIDCTQYSGCDSDYGGWVAFEVEKDSVWLIQIGNAPGTPPGLGQAGITVKPSLDHLYRYDGGPSGGGNGFGPNGVGEYVWMNRYNAQGGADTLVQIEVAFGSQFGVITPLVDGTPARVAVWSDPNQDGNPDDAVLLASVATTVQDANTGNPVTIYLPEPVAVQGKFFVGAALPVTPGQAPAAGVSSPWDGWLHAYQAWTGFNAGGPIDLNCLGCLSPPPAHLWGVNGNLIVRARGGAESNTYCFGDGSGAACPCGNLGAANTGCAHAGAVGGLLWSTGSSQVSSDDLVLRAIQLPPSGIGLAVAGSQMQAGGAGVPFQDGLLCVGGTVFRYPAQPFAGSLQQGAIVAASNGKITAGATWNFQVWYRDFIGACGSPTGNLSNALTVDFTP